VSKRLTCKNWNEILTFIKPALNLLNISCYICFSNSFDVKLGSIKKVNNYVYNYDYSLNYINIIDKYGR
jgi:hypothetical protein